MRELDGIRRQRLNATVRAVNEELRSLIDDFGDQIEVRPYVNFGDDYARLVVDIKTGLFRIDGE